MAKVRSKDTGPEMVVRKLVHAMGYRYRLHRKDLPGAPDLVFASLGKVIFVHGCFWHLHQGCSLARMPKSRLDFWKPKLEANRERDKKNLRQLKKLGWTSITIWECQLGDDKKLRDRIERFLNA
ncbi:MAG: DNA mismatch endonuclease Vsr [Acidobacteria bacterium]|nr:DNA mismatch endonuclease Vsr [Acidobacteriota bacterium]